MASDERAILREHLLDAIRGHQAHIEFDAAVKDFPPELQGKKPAGAPHSAWQLLEHLRIAQSDILEFSAIQSISLPRGRKAIGQAQRRRRPLLPGRKASLLSNGMLRN